MTWYGYLIRCSVARGASTDQQVCGSCGTVLGDRIVDTRSECKLVGACSSVVKCES